MAEQATNVFLPFGGVGGLALGAWALRQGGMSVERIARRSVAFFVVTSIPNFLCTALCATLIVFGAPVRHAPFALSLVFAHLAWTTMLVVALLPRFIDWLSSRKAPKHGESLYRRARRALRTGATTVADGVRDAIMLVQSRQPYTLIGAAGYMGFDLLAAGGRVRGVRDDAVARGVHPRLRGRPARWADPAAGRYRRDRRWPDRRPVALREPAFAGDRRGARLPRLPARPAGDPRLGRVRPAAPHAGPRSGTGRAVRAV